MFDANRFLKARWEVITPTLDEHEGSIYSMVTPLNDFSILIMGGENKIEYITIYTPKAKRWDKVTSNNTDV